MIATISTATGERLTGVQGRTIGEACELARGILEEYPEGATITCGVRTEWMFYGGTWTRTRGRGWRIDRVTLVEATKRKGWVQVDPATPPPDGFDAAAGTFSVNVDPGPTAPGGVEVRQPDGSTVGFLVGNGRLRVKP